jgi:hypothetical protein
LTCQQVKVEHLEIGGNKGKKKEGKKKTPKEKKLKLLLILK